MQTKWKDYFHRQLQLCSGRSRIQLDIGYLQIEIPHVAN